MTTCHLLISVFHLSLCLCLREMMPADVIIMTAREPCEFSPYRLWSLALRCRLLRLTQAINERHRLPLQTPLEPVYTDDPTHRRSVSSFPSSFCTLSLTHTHTAPSLSLSLSFSLSLSHSHTYLLLALAWKSSTSSSVFKSRSCVSSTPRYENLRKLFFFAFCWVVSAISLFPPPFDLRSILINQSSPNQSVVRLWNAREFAEA